MTARKFNFRPALLVLLAVALVSYACTRVEDNSRSASLLTMTSVQGVTGAASGTGQTSTPLLSDTCDSPNTAPQDPQTCVVVNDNADLTFRNDFLQIGPGSGVSGGPTFLNDVVVSRYRVDYIRPNGRNTPGVDVPFGIDGTMNVTVPANNSATGSIIVVRHEAKREPPLSELDNGPAENVLTANAQIQCYGTDLAGRVVSAIGWLEIHFANYAESQ